MLNDIKELLAITNSEKDYLLTLLIEQATQEALKYTHREQITQSLAAAIVKMVVYNYNRLGSEGVDSENYSGVGFSYSADYPASIIRLLTANRKLRTL